MRVGELKPIEFGLITIAELMLGVYRFRVSASGLGFRVSGLGFRVSGFGFRV